MEGCHPQKFLVGHMEPLPLPLNYLLELLLNSTLLCMFDNIP
ncbi:unnamed protein product, partial [Vitis vinifera]|uniref:Uncharacterized protein n=1 Tax=Vitis vinifera TaxID=29760 RepID=D7SRP2_VITVI